MTLIVTHLTNKAHNSYSRVVYSKDHFRSGRHDTVASHGDGCAFDILAGWEVGDAKDSTLVARFTQSFLRRFCSHSLFFQDKVFR